MADVEAVAEAVAEAKGPMKPEHSLRSNFSKARTFSSAAMLQDAPQPLEKEQTQTSLIHEDDVAVVTASQQIVGSMSQVQGERNFGPSDSPFPALAFVEAERFREVTLVLLLANTVQLAMEADSPDYFGWICFDVVFFVIWLIELSMRIAYKWKWFLSGKDLSWCRFDTVLVLVGFLEVCCQALLAGSDSGFMLFLKLSRLGRVFRFFHLSPRLNLFMSALFIMMQTFVWVFSLLFLFCVIFAILCTNILRGRTSQDVDMIEELEVIDAHFGDVFSSFFTLFQLTTQDNWCDFALPVVAILPGFRLFFVGFMAICSWTMIAMLTAVASDSMLEATCDRKEKERRQQVQKQDAFIQYLRKVFKEGDADGNGEMDKDEFEVLVKNPIVLGEMKALGSGLTQDELRAAWAMLDFQDSGVLTIEEFVDGIAYLMDTLSTRHILNVDGKVKRAGFKIGRILTTLTEGFTTVLRQNKEIMDIIQEEEQWQEQQARYLGVWKQWAAQHDKAAFQHARDSCKFQRRRLSNSDPLFQEEE